MINWDMALTMVSKLTTTESFLRLRIEVPVDGRTYINMSTVSVKPLFVLELTSDI